MIVVVLGSADSGIAETVITNPERRVLQEVLDTEHVYVTDLKQVVQVSLRIRALTALFALQPLLPSLSLVPF